MSYLYPRPPTNSSFIFPTTVTKTKLALPLIVLHFSKWQFHSFCLSGQKTPQNHPWLFLSQSTFKMAAKPASSTFSLHAKSHHFSPPPQPDHLIWATVISPQSLWPPHTHTPQLQSVPRRLFLSPLHIRQLMILLCSKLKWWGVSNNCTEVSKRWGGKPWGMWGKTPQAKRTASINRVDVGVFLDLQFYWSKKSTDTALSHPETVLYSVSNFY